MKNMGIYIRASIITKLSRKESFIFAFISNILILFLAYFLWKSIYTVEGNLNPIFWEIIVQLYLATCISSLTTTNIEWNISNEIISGNIVLSLLKPVNFFYLKLSEFIGIAICNLVTNALPILIIIYVFFHRYVSLEWGIIFFIIACMMSSLLIFCIDYMIGLLSFYTESVWGSSMVKSTLILFFSGAVVPLKLFPENFRNVILISPFGSIFQVPISFLVKSKQPFLEKYEGVIVQACWVLVFLFALFAFNKRIFKKIKVNGG